MSTVRAAVLDPVGSGLRVCDIATPASVDAGLVRVSVRASGVRHSDLHRGPPPAVSHRS